MQCVTLSTMDGVLFPEPVERFDAESGLPLPEDDDPELSAALAEWQDALAERAALRADGGVGGDGPLTAR